MLLIQQAIDATYIGEEEKKVEMQIDSEGNTVMKSDEE